MEKLPLEIKHRINSFNKENPWKNKFDDVLKEITLADFVCEISWNCDSCYECYEDQIEFTNRISHDRAYNFYLDHYNGRVSTICDCVINYCKIYSEYGYIPRFMFV